MGDNLGAYEKLKDPTKESGAKPPDYMMENPGVYEELKDPKNPGVYDELKDQKTKSGVAVTDHTVANPGVFHKKENLVLRRGRALPERVEPVSRIMFLFKICIASDS